MFNIFRPFFSRALLILPVIFLQTAGMAQSIHQLYDEILNDHIKNGLVNYENLIADPRFQLYLESLSNTDPESLENKDKKLAFWINAYNAFTLKIISDNYPLESINNLNPGGMALAQLFGNTVWDEKFIIINGEKYSLNDIEHGIIRNQFNDPRIHFALVCAALSCPSLRSEAYIEEKLNEQLNEQGKLFSNNIEKNRFNLQNKTAYLSRYFDWYSEDFGNNENEILIFLTDYLNDPDVVNSINKNSSQWEIKYIPYNWCLNGIGSEITDERCVTDWDSVTKWLGDPLNIIIASAALVAAVFIIISK